MRRSVGLLVGDHEEVKHEDDEHEVGQQGDGTEDEGLAREDQCDGDVHGVSDDLIRPGTDEELRRIEGIRSSSTQHDEVPSAPGAEKDPPTSAERMPRT